MATLKYLSATSIDGADKYRLYKNNSGLRPNELDPEDRISVQSKLLDFEHYGVIGTNGKMVEKETEIFYDYHPEGTGNSVLGRPLRRITEDGIRYCVGVSAWVSLNYGSAINTPALLSGEYDGLTSEYFTIHGGTGFYKESDGWYLHMQVKQGSPDSDFSDIKIRMFDLDDDIKYVGFGKGQTTVFIHYVELNDKHRHTEYIPIDLLDDKWAYNNDINVCVGGFDFSEDSYDYPKMAFYDENMKFIGGANSSWLSEWVSKHTEANTNNKYFYKSGSIYYFTKEAVEDIADGAVNAYASENNTYAKDEKFVVFSSRWSGTAIEDKVSVPNLYFPLFAMRDVLVEGTNYLFATADAESKYFTESPASNVVIYEV